jgi:hypothetical protein
VTNARLFEVRPDTGGWLTVSNGRHVASIAILRGSMTASFVPAADGQGGTLIHHGGDANGQPVSDVDDTARLIRRRPYFRCVQAVFIGLPVLRAAPARDGNGLPCFFSARFN